jgi:hypothetical protein
MSIIRHESTRKIHMSVLSSNRRIAVVGLSLLCSAVAMAAAGKEEIPEALLKCAAVTDDVRRLECFDEELAELRPPSIVEDVVENPPTEPVEAEQAASPPSVDKAPAATVASEPAPPPPAGAVVPAAASAVDEFGMTEELAKNSTDVDWPAELTEISATVTEVHKRPGGEHIVTLDNGQVWTEKRVEHGFRVKEGDTLVIKKGRMGGYRMIRGYHSSSAIRVE